MTSLPCREQLLQQELPDFLTGRERIRLRLFISAQIATKPQKSSREWERMESWHRLDVAWACQLDGPAINCHRGCAAESGGQLTSAVQVRKFTQLLPFSSLAFSVSLINMYLEKSMLLLKLLFSKSSCLNRSSHTQHQALLKSAFWQLINPSMELSSQDLQ